MSEAMNQDLRPLQELGGELRKAREARALSIEDVAAATCIRKNFLEDIEAGCFDNFVALVYARGFVRTDAEFLEEPELWQEFNPQLTLDSFQAGRSQKNLGSNKTKRVTQLLISSKKQPPSAAPTRGFKHSSLRRNCIVVLLVLIVGGCAALWANWGRIKDEISKIQQEQAYNEMKAREAAEAARIQKQKAEIEAIEREQAAKRAAEAAAAAASADAAVSSGDAAAAGTAPKAEGAPLKSPANTPVPEGAVQEQSAKKGVLVVKVSGDCWMRLTQGKRVLTERIAKRGFEQSYDLGEAIVGRFGAGHHAEISVNGGPFQAIGRGVQRLEIRPDGTVLNLGK